MLISAKLFGKMQPRMARASIHTLHMISKVPEGAGIGRYARVPHGAGPHVTRATNEKKRCMSHQAITSGAICIDSSWRDHPGRDVCEEDSGWREGGGVLARVEWRWGRM